MHRSLVISSFMLGYARCGGQRIRRQRTPCARCLGASSNLPEGLKVLKAESRFMNPTDFSPMK